MRSDAKPDVMVLCGPSLLNALGQAGRTWRTRSEVPGRLFMAPLAQHAELSQHGAQVDILAGIGARQIGTAEAPRRC